ncbi:MAG: winged helix-turn-helix domain-containing protein [Anaerolineaceae bacterium]|nr:winged helix-turn-helix domain-containing protein [Anaerolineaceae bacterium]
MPALPLITTGWTVSRSILLELDTAIAFVCGGTVSGILPAELAVLSDSVPNEWRTEFIHFMGEVKGNPSYLEQMALLADCLYTTNYSQSTLKLRNFTLEEARQAALRQAKEFNLEPDPTLSGIDQIADLKNRLNYALYQSLGFQVGGQDMRIHDRFLDLRQALRTLQGGDLHEQFWQWLDRFYYQVYEPWHMGRSAYIDQQEKRVIAALGGQDNLKAPPSLEWLSEKNALRSIPELREAVLHGQLQVVFWIEPFGLHDNWVIAPGKVTVACSEPGQLVDNFFHFTEDLAFRLQALSDPTRLLILRLIRNFGMTNTDMADYLGLARPTISVHASILRKAGLIQSDPEGRITRHKILPDELARLFADLDKFLDLPGRKGEM